MGYSLPLRAGLRAALLLSAALMFLAVAQTAQADTVAFSTIDKSDLAGIDACGPNCFNMIGASGGGSPVQTFTATTDGDLTKIKASVARFVMDGDYWDQGGQAPGYDPSTYPWQPLTVEVRPWANGQIGSTVLASATIAADDVPIITGRPSAVSWPTVDAVFAQPAQLTAGAQYAVVLSSRHTPSVEVYDAYHYREGYYWTPSYYTTPDPYLCTGWGILCNTSFYPGGERYFIWYYDDGYPDTLGDRNPASDLMLTFYYADTAPPTVSCDDAPAGWHGSNVSVACTAHDDGGLANPDDGSFSLSTSVADGSETANASTGSRQVCDTSNQCTTADPITGIKVDRKGPSISLTSPDPAGTDSYLIDSSHTAAFGCVDGGSDIATCLGTGSNGSLLDTSSVGQHTFSVDASDNAGNGSHSSTTYDVIWPYSGFLAPVNNKQSSGQYVLNATKAGSAIPVKFSLGGNRGLNILAAGSPSSGSVACSASASTDPIEQTVTAGTSSLSYDSASGQYAYVWKTDKAWAGSCRQLSVRLIDGTTHKASFQFTK